MAEWASDWLLMSGSQTMYVKLKVFNQTGTSTAKYTLCFSTTGSDSNLYTSSYGSLSCQIGTRTVSNELVSGGSYSISNISASGNSWPSATNIVFKWDKTALASVYRKESTYVSIAVESGGGGGGGVVTPNDNPPQASNLTTKGYAVGNNSYVEVSFTRRLYKDDGTEDTSINIGVPGRRIYTNNGSAMMRNSTQDYSRKPSGTTEKLYLEDGAFTPGRSYNYELTLETTFANGYVDGQIYILDAIKSVQISTIPMQTTGTTFRLSSGYTTEYGGRAYDYSVTYSSSNSNIISVSGDRITYNQNGSATISVTYTQYFPEIGVTVTKTDSQLVICGAGFPTFNRPYQYINNGLCRDIWTAQVYLSGQSAWSTFTMPHDLSEIIQSGNFCTYVKDVYDLLQYMCDNTRALYYHKKGTYPDVPATFPKLNRSGNSWKTIVNNIVSNLEYLYSIS